MVSLADFIGLEDVDARGDLPAIQSRSTESPGLAPWTFAATDDVGRDRHAEDERPCPHDPNPHVPVPDAVLGEARLDRALVDL
jgi:hypothetical protein